MEVLENEQFRELGEGAQLLYIYSSLMADGKGVLEDASNMEGYLYIDFYKELDILMRYGLVSYYGEHDTIGITKDPTIEWER